MKLAKSFAQTRVLLAASEDHDAERKVILMEGDNR